MTDSAIVYGPECQTYDFGPQHPFTPLRGSMLVDLLVQLGAGAHLVRPQCATRRDVRRMHSEAYVAAVETASRGDKLAYAAGYGLGTTDVPVFSGMHQATLSACG